jgi:hypothetical protein
MAAIICFFSNKIIIYVINVFSLTCQVYILGAIMATIAF